MRRFLLLFFGIIFCGQLWAQRTVTGKVTDDKGVPVSNASVVVKGTNQGTVTNDQGVYSIVVPANGTSLIISASEIGTREVSIGTQTTIDVTLQATEKSLEAVVVTGLTTRRRSEFTGSSSKVVGSDIAQNTNASLDQILQGRAPGLYIASGSGQPGSAARVNIRGVGSISGNNDPLYVLDGIPIEAQVFRTLNPNDFESVDVLKDAAGAGQYGSRGANGVIVITTKRGKVGRPQLSYRGMTGFSQPPGLNNVRMMNTEERLAYEEQLLGRFGVISGVSNSNGNPVLSAGNGITGYPGWDYSPNNPRYQLLTPTQRASEALLLDSIRKINTDWADLFFRNGTFQQHEVSASGGANNLGYFTSLSMFKQEGVVIRSNLDRYTFRGNIDFKTNRLTAAVRSFGGWSKQDGIESEASVTLANPIAAAYLELPYRRAFRDDGTIATGSGFTGANAYDRIFTTTATTNQFKGNLGITLGFDIWNGIGLRSTNGIDYRNNNTSRFVDPASFVGASATGGQGLYNEGNSENLQLISTSGLTYTKNINSGQHVINAQAMVEAIRNRFRSFGATGFGINPNLPNTPAGITAGSATNNFIPTFTANIGKTYNGLYSNFLIGDYTYNRKYTISGNLRRDVLSQVPEKNKDNFFWGVGLGWNLFQEGFMANQNVFQEARLRASYGETGNVNGFTSDFGYISTYGGSSTGYAGVPATVPTSPGNQDYSLESQVITNIGTDLTLLNRRMRVTADYYIKKSQNLFVSQGLTRVSGFNTLNTNAGEVENRGFEFRVEGDALRTSDLLVTLGVNGAFNKNEVTSLGLLTEIPQGTGIIRVGYPIGSHFMVGYKGVDPGTGLPIYEDINGNPTSQYNAANNRAEYGTYLPAFQGGANLDATWKGFDFSALFTTAQGVKRYNNESFFYESANSNFQFNKRVEILTETWQKPGDMTIYQRINSPRQINISRDIRDASFVRFRNLQVGYTLKLKNQKVFSGIRLWGQGQNLYTWTKWEGFDPEESNNIATYEFPNPRSYTIGLDVNF